MANYQTCTEVNPECPVELTILGYRPNLGANVFFLVFFALATIAQLICGIKWKTWTFCIALTIGCILELIGYAGRVLLWEKPFSIEGFTIQIACLIIAPAFMAAGIYLTLKHFVLALGREYSLISPQLYTWIFICIDILSIVVQAAGAGMTVSGSVGTVKTGTDVALAGIAFQIASLAVFGLLAGFYFTKVWRNQQHLSPEATTLWNSRKLKLFASAMILAYLAVLTRCCYRLPELAHGLSGVFRDQIDFMVLDGAMIGLMALAMTVFHPGHFFPQLSAPFLKRARQERRGQSKATPHFSGLEEGKGSEESEQALHSTGRR